MKRKHRLLVEFRKMLLQNNFGLKKTAKIVRAVSYRIMGDEYTLPAKYFVVSASPFYASSWWTDLNKKWKEYLLENNFDDDHQVF